MQIGNSPAHTHASLKNQNKPIDNKLIQAYEGKVIAINPDDSTVDIALYNGQILRNVRVLFNSANTVAGFRYLSSIVNTNSAVNTPYGINDMAVKTKIADTLATIIYVQGNTLAPRVIGFSFPQDAQMHVDEQGLALFRHESGFYALVDKNGHFEMRLPDGSHIIAATDTTPKQLDTGEEAQDWNPPTSPNQVKLTINLVQGVTVSIQNGTLNITTSTDLDLNAGGTLNLNGSVKINGKTPVTS